jgi:hypothetical protein
MEVSGQFPLPLLLPAPTHWIGGGGERERERETGGGAASAPGLDIVEGRGKKSLEPPLLSLKGILSSDFVIYK